MHVHDAGAGTGRVVEEMERGQANPGESPSAQGPSHPATGCRAGQRKAGMVGGWVDGTRQLLQPSCPSASPTWGVPRISHLCPVKHPQRGHRKAGREQ